MWVTPEVHVLRTHVGIALAFFSSPTIVRWGNGCIHHYGSSKMIWTILFLWSLHFELLQSGEWYNSKYFGLWLIPNTIWLGSIFQRRNFPPYFWLQRPFNTYPFLNILQAIDNKVVCYQRIIVQARERSDMELLSCAEMFTSLEDQVIWGFYHVQRRSSEFQGGGGGGGGGHGDIKKKNSKNKYCNNLLVVMSKTSLCLAVLYGFF